MTPTKRTEEQVEAFIDWLGDKNVQDTIMVFMVLMYRNGYFDRADMEELLNQGGKSAK